MTSAPTATTPATTAPATHFDSPDRADVPHFDVLIVGAGLSGIGAAYRLQTDCPGQTYAILEGRAASGGTWDLFRYPGIRSDSDMFTLGYPFRPWKEAKAIAEGPSILNYIRETASEYDIDSHIRYDHKVVSASWDSATARWTVATVSTGGAPGAYTCSFLYMCSGYYSYEGGHMPEFPGAAEFSGTLIHPQKWPEDLDFAGKKVVIIGSGATAITLLPAMADKADHVTMLQRSPTYITSLPATDPIAVIVRRFLPEKLAHQINRWKSVLLTTAFYQFCRRRPKAARKLLRAAIAKQLPGHDLDPNFNPSYNPWDQRMCLVPDGDLFKAIAAGKGSIVTDQIDHFTSTGIKLAASGQELEADVVISATGLELVPCGGISITVDGTDVIPGETYVYRGCMLSDIPNFAMCVGYTNASWTLRADLSSQHVCRLINYMDKYGYVRAVPRHRERDRRSSGLLDLNSGYIQRAAAILPKQGSKSPWRLRQNYVLDFFSAKFGDITKSVEFARPHETAARPTHAGQANRELTPIP